MAFAVAAFISSDVLLRLGLPWLPEFITQLGLSILLGGFSLLILSGLVLLGKRVGMSISEYFSAPQTQLRKLWFTQNQQLNLSQRFQLQQLKLYLNYETQRRRLLNADNQRQLRALAKTINKQLRPLKKRVPKTTYQQWRHELSVGLQQQDSLALLTLQQKIATWTPT